MSQGNIQRPTEPPKPPVRERLESWKDIANYLNRGVRTVQRWESEEGLPVHRHTHDKLGTVYSYKAELDAWWENGRPRLEQQERVRQVSRRRRLGWGLALAAVVVAVVAGGITLWLTERPPALPFEERDWVLVASFENRTGEAVLDGTLEHALERELTNSRFVNVVPRERIQDTLQLMRKPADTPIDAALGREICLRDGCIRALLSGRVEKLDSTYVLSVGLTNPADGVTVASFSEEAVEQKGLVPAVGRLSSRVRETLGEQLRLIRQSDQKLAKATTPSLRALQHYSRGVVLVDYPAVSNKWGSATELLQQAVAEDPKFASAHIWLAHSLHNIGKKDEATPHYESAFELADTTTDRERYFILGSYYWRHLGDNEKAAQAFEVLLQLHPDHYWGMNKLAWIYSTLGRQQESARYRMQLADLRPNDLVSNWLAFWVSVDGEGEPEKARPYLLRARQLAALPGIEGNIASWVRSTTAAEYWQQGHMEKVFSEVTRFEQIARSGSRQGRDGLAIIIGRAHLSLGKLKLAEQWFHRILKPEDRSRDLAYVALLRGDRQGLIDVADSLKKLPVWQTIYLARAVRAGLLSEAEAAIPDLENSEDFPDSGFISIRQLRGELALARGNTGQAIALLEEAIELWGAFRVFGFGGSETLASAWEQQGNFQRAIGVLEAVRPFRTRYVFPLIAPEWMKTQLRLAQLYRKAGREQEAREIEAELLKLLTYADPDHPMLVELKGSQEVALSQPPT